MIHEPKHTLNMMKWRANRGLATKEGYQWYEIDAKGLMPIKGSKLDSKRPYIEPLIEKHVDKESIIDLGCDKGYFAWYAMRCGYKKVIANEISPKLVDYLKLLYRTMNWPIQLVETNLFESDYIPQVGYALSLAMIHQVGQPAEMIVPRIRSMVEHGACIEFCEDYQWKFGSRWNRPWFEELLSKHFESFELTSHYEATAEPGKQGTRYVYDCCCH